MKNNCLFRSHLLVISAFFALALSSSNTLALDAINSSFIGNVAIEGYDTVAYFTDGRAIEGSKKFQFEWMGANWRFSSAENLSTFKANPEKYAPQFGGYCAYAVSQNSTAGIEPDKFSIVNGKLYLNYNKDVFEKWRLNKNKYIKDAERFWPGLSSK